MVWRHMGHCTPAVRPSWICLVRLSSILSLWMRACAWASVGILALVGVRLAAGQLLSYGP